MIYELVIATKGRISFVPDDLRYFDDHFVCQSMANSWEIPPAGIIGTSGKIPDFVSWMLRAPVVSEQAKAKLENVCAELVEFLPFHELKGKRFFAINVLNQDENREVFKKSPSSVVFVRNGFGEVIRDNGLTGVELADPKDDIGKKIVRGERVNCFPGVIG